ncbi:MAG TPA: TonB family protein [Acidiferrobacterales bacterium]|nr:TonB family protein [Acidiferrobacterales bacterium]
MTRLTRFLAASTLLHGLLLAGSGEWARVEAGVDSEILSVSLEAGGISAPSRGARAALALPLSAAVAPGATSSRVDASEPPVSPETGTAGRSEQDAAARVRARVLNDLARHFYYPPIARMRTWEGRVLLAFHVGQDGLLHEPRLVHTSGFGVLDEAALNSLRKVVRVADAGGPRLDMEVPVIYRLTDAR